MSVTRTAPLIEIEHAFRAMNTLVRLVVVTRDGSYEAEATIQRVEALFVETERTLSRFRPESELSQLNQNAGRPFIASPLLFRVVRAALDVARSSGGIFDPTILNALRAAGYDRSFETLSDRARPTGRTKRSGGTDWRHARLDPSTRTICLPEGVGLDLGGIGKGWAVDRAVEALGMFANFGVDAGGDLFCRGVQADGQPWTVGVEDPLQPEKDLLVLRVENRAVATSTTTRRRWIQDGRARHHLIDPRTGRPADSGVLAASVVAGNVVRAETLAKIALILGPRDGLDLIEEAPDAEGLLVLANGETRRTGGIAGYVRVV